MMVLYFFHGAALFISNAFDPALHRHHLMEIFVSMGGSLKIQKENYTYEAGNFIIDIDIPHKVEGSNNTYAVLLIDSESSTARQLRKKYLNETGINTLSDSLFVAFQEELFFLFKNECPVEKAQKIYSDIIRHLLGGVAVEITHIDPRIEKVIDMLHQSHEKKITIKELADRIGLSESRLIHLFSQHIGIPIRRYLLWLRMLDAADLIINGHSFTFAAHESGFSDSAHLSRTFKKMFGFKLLEIFKNNENSRFIQVRAK